MDSAFTQREGMVILLGYGIFMFMLATYYLKPSKTKENYLTTPALDGALV